jgi:hypothetical protein
LEENFPPDLFGPLWDKLTELVHDGRFVLSREVRREYEAKAEGPMLEWIKFHSSSIADPDPEATFRQAQSNTELAALIGDTDGTRPNADPFVVALALRLGLCVVTKEVARGGGKKIPKVCERLGVGWTSLHGMLRSEGWGSKSARSAGL